MPSGRSHEGGFSCFSYWAYWLLPFGTTVVICSLVSFYVCFGMPFLEQVYFSILPNSAALFLRRTYLFYTYDNTLVGPTPCVLSDVAINFSASLAVASWEASMDQACLRATSALAFSQATPRNEPETCSVYSGTYFLLGDGPERLDNACMVNFYHVLVEYIARIHITLEQSGVQRTMPISILLPPQDHHAVPPAQYAPLLAAVLAWPSTPNILDMYTKKKSTVCAKKLVVGWATGRVWYHTPAQTRTHDPSFARGFDSFRVLLGERLLLISNGRFNAHAECSLHNRLAVLFWGRGKKGRSVINREELLADLVDALPETMMSITSVDPTLLPLRKQLALITKADVLVGPHGAGLSWIALMPPRSTLVELVPSLYFRYELYENLAAVSGNHHYIYTVCESRVDAWETSARWNSGADRHKNHKMRCDPHRVAAVLRLAHSSRMCEARPQHGD